MMKIYELLYLRAHKLFLNHFPLYAENGCNFIQIFVICNFYSGVLLQNWI